jgi:hypothetical protein
MGFLVSFSFFFLALIINQSTVVGQTTAESVIEFPKNDIRDIKMTMIDTVVYYPAYPGTLQNVRVDLTTISLNRKNAVVQYGNPDIVNEIFFKCVTDEDYYNCTGIHYNNGVTQYDEMWISP